MNRVSKTILILVVAMLFCPVVSSGHSGRTDAAGGHRDNQNKSGLGSYHYHCGGNPPHLHDNGGCPYSSNTKATQSATKRATQSPTKKAVVTPSKIKITNAPTSLIVEDTFYLKSKIFPSASKNKDVTWKSSNERIAVVNSDGKVKAKKPGKVAITASTNNYMTDTFELVIKEIKVAAIKIKKPPAKIAIGEKIQLDTKISPKNASNKKVKWKSSDETRVKVNSKGKLSALATGDAEITVYQKKISDSFDIRICPEVSRVKIRLKETEVSSGKELLLNGEVLPASTSQKTLEWTSSNEMIASIEGGKLYAHEPGTVTITATAENGKTDSVAVQVKPYSLEDVLIGLLLIGAAILVIRNFVKKRKRQ